jgi:VacB/RNase II family 3'-5' exoribonuclease
MNRASEPCRDRLKSIARNAMLEKGLLPDYSAAVVAETNAISNPAKADASFRDLRSLPWVSIDNDDSRDLDQLSVAVPLSGAAVKILVAIADVDAIVKKGSAIDGHARTNTTSVYTAAEIFSMLPEKLSTDLTSLGESQERLAIVIEMTLGSGDGVVTGSDIYRAVVVNHAKLAYNGVAAWLDGTAPAPAQVSSMPEVGEQLRLQDRIAQAMKSLRHQHGALSLETIEARPVFDGDVLADLRAEKKNRAAELIEEFMIAANGVTAKLLDSSNFPSLRRVLRVPERWDRIVDLAADFGARLPSKPDIKALENFLVQRRQADPAHFPDLSLSVIKLLGRGEYALDLPGQVTQGHFGLAVKDYTHSTAPNRRYPDLITQRLLKAALQRQPVPYSGEELGALARHCTDNEDAAAKVERQVQKSAAALLLEPRIGEQFDAIVTGASAKGTWVRIMQPVTEGRVVRGDQGLDVGDRVRVKLVDTNVERGFIDFARVAGS